MSLPGLMLVIHVSSNAPGSSSGERVMARIMASNATDQCAPDTALGVDWSGGHQCCRDSKGKACAKYTHGDSPYKIF